MRDTAGSAAAPAARCRKFRRGSFIFEPPSRFTSLDHLVGERDQRGRHVEAKRAGGDQVDNKVEFCRLRDGKVGRFLAFEYATRIDADELVLVVKVRPVTDQPADLGKFARKIDGG